MTFVLGMALTYTLAGVAVGYFGARANLQMHMQNPWVITAFAGVFVVLALSMFGWFELQLPAALRNRINDLNQHQQGGSFPGVLMMGVLSALVASPCVSAPLAGVLVYISATGDAVLGGGALFALSLGMGAPLVLIGATGKHLLPRSGPWMLMVRNAFGVMLLGIALWLLQRVLSGALSLMLWAALLVIVGVHVHAMNFQSHAITRTLKGVALLVITVGLTLLYNSLHHPDSPITLPLGQSSSAMAGTNSSEQLTPVTQPTPFIRVNSLEEMQAAMATAPATQHIMLDYYAQWCASCKVMDEAIFKQKEVLALRKDLLFLQVDLTSLTEEHQKMLDHFGLFGPPSIQFFNAQGEELREARIQGEITKEGFLAHLARQVF
jgi:thiol:disulfide interchange protein DsbD